MSSSRRRTLELVISQVAAQISLVAVLPVITRAYSTGEVGEYQLAMAFAMTIQPMATLRAEFAVPSLTSDSSVVALLRRAYATLLTLSIGSILIALTLFLLGHAGHASVITMSGLLLLGLGWTALDSSKLIRQSKQRRLAVRNLGSGFVAAVLQLAVALLGGHIFLLALSILLARALAIVTTSARISGYVDASLPELRPYTHRRMAASICSGVVATATGQTLIFAAAVGQSAAASGYVGIAQRVAGAPLTLLGQGLAQAMQSHIAPLVRDNLAGVQKRMWRQVLVLSTLATVFAMLLITLAPPLSVPLLGEGWQPAGTVIAILAIPMAFQLLVGPLMTVLPLLGREGLLLTTQIARFLVVVGGVAIAITVNGDLYAVAMAYAVSTVIGYCGMLAVVSFAARKYDLQAR